jgi:hypothetical protein
VGEPGENLVRPAEAEVVQHDDDLLAILPVIGGAAHDHRRRHQALLLQAVMRVHPMGARQRHEAVAAGRPGGDRRRLRPGKSVVFPRRRLPVPVDDGRHLGRIDEIDAEALARPQRDAGLAAGADEPEHARRLAVDVEVARGRGELLRGGLTDRRRRCPRYCRCETGGEEATTGHGHDGALLIFSYVCSPETRAAQIESGRTFELISRVMLQ